MNVTTTCCCVVSSGKHPWLSQSNAVMGTTESVVLGQQKGRRAHVISLSPFLFNNCRQLSFRVDIMHGCIGDDTNRCARPYQCPDVASGNGPSGPIRLLHHGVRARVPSGTPQTKTAEMKESMRRWMKRRAIPSGNLRCFHYYEVW